MPTHAGGIVVRPTRHGPTYLIVRARRDRSQWIFPKGRIERGETAEEAAVREVEEEAGVRAAIVKRLPSNGPGGEIALFLMRHRKDVPLEEEDRDPEWVDYDEARRRLSFADSRDALEQAHRVVEKG